jgi:hypothetical protein
VTIPPYLQGLDRVAFVCGCGHSGTTLVATILSAHPRIFVPLYETEAFLASEAEAASALEGLRQNALSAGKRIIIEKTPRHVRRMPLIRRMVPGSRFVLLVRDGRDAAASFAKRMNNDYVAGVGRWVQDNTIILREREKPDVLVMRYEDIVVDPGREVRRLCDFIGVAYLDELLAYHERPRLWYGKTDLRDSEGQAANHEDRRNWQVNQPIFDGRGRWKKDLPPEVAEQFYKGWPLRLMQEFGYADAEPAAGRQT